MTDEQNAADMHRDQATDEDSPHAHQAPERRSWTDTTISTLTARWPTVLALVLVLILIPVIVLGGADVELAPGPAVMAGIYMVAYALGRPTAAWPRSRRSWWCCTPSGSTTPTSTRGHG